MVQKSQFAMNFEDLEQQLSGELYYDNLHKTIYATDASVYQQLPKAVAFPKTKEDIKTLITFAKNNKLSLIPRAAGTSLAGQCVGEGIVVDTGRNFYKVLEVNVHDKTVITEPGVIRDDLNRDLKKYGLFFGPNTSTSNRCMLGGMVGNNSSGTTSIQYGTTRDKIISLKCILSDGHEVVFKSESLESCQAKVRGNGLEAGIYGFVLNLLNNKDLKAEIISQFPKPDIHRRNTGYAIDDLLKYYEDTQQINLARLICGSEGTLAFVTEIELQLDDLPPEHSAMLAAHFSTIEDCMQAVPVCMNHDLYACEMMDDTILDCTKNHLKYKEYRFFLQGEPKAILLLELNAYSKNDLQNQILALKSDLESHTKTYASPVLYDDDIEKALNLRKAGLGLLGGIVGDHKAVACIEDTAVSVEDLPNYISEFAQLMKTYDQKPVYYAHAGAGELHLRPILNLKTQQGVEDFKAITKDVANLVKSYRGSLSGEHGDGIVRSNFIELMIGEKCYQVLKDLKATFDSNYIFNPGKIINAYPIDKNMRYVPDRSEPKPESFLNFKKEQDLLHAAENCNGSGDCRKSAQADGGMCPSYHATKNEKDTTRARANALRHYMTNPKSLHQDELMSVFDLCISCKACKRECPSNVDVSAFKAEVTYQYYKTHKRPFRDYAIAYNDRINAYFQPIAGMFNYGSQNKSLSKPVKKLLGFHESRSLPTLSSQTFEKYLKTKANSNQKPPQVLKSVYLFVDEFTNRLEADIGKDAYELLTALGYEVKTLSNKQSGRAYLSKGFLEKAKNLAEYNINLFKDVISKETPLIGIEPSAILSFRDDYLRLVDDTNEAEKLSKNVFLIDEFLSQEIKEGNINSTQFTSEACEVKLHLHCHQKALSNSKFTFDMVNVIENAKVSIIPSGCCGMAGGFGYEKEHYEVSQNIGELILLPAVRKASESTYILANGSSCRHQIKDATARQALHPVSFLKLRLKS
jgi:FAD/FMN-containing dehydrogenase/Fe-S oxidoreductase